MHRIPFKEAGNGQEVIGKWKLFIFVLALFPLPSYSLAQEIPSDIAKEIGFILDRAYESYTAGDPRKAKAYVGEAYFL
ncbi:MAG: hypothetical protein HY878_03285 [Deltaproteobacteria bacterium]|nr:hypothetical protein [Deltaproteobacteria bacterium]